MQNHYGTRSNGLVARLPRTKGIPLWRCGRDASAIGQSPGASMETVPENGTVSDGVRPRRARCLRHGAGAAPSHPSCCCAAAGPGARRVWRRDPAGLRKRRRLGAGHDRPVPGSRGRAMAARARGDPPLPRLASPDGAAPLCRVAPEHGGPRGTRTHARGRRVGHSERARPLRRAGRSRRPGKRPAPARARRREHRRARTPLRGRRPEAHSRGAIGRRGEARTRPRAGHREARRGVDGTALRRAARQSCGVSCGRPPIVRARRTSTGAASSGSW